MNALLLNNIPVLSPEDSKDSVADTFVKTTHSYLAVVNNGLFLGMISKAALDRIDFKRLEEVSYLFVPDAIAAQSHWLNYGLFFKKVEWPLAAVVSSEGFFQGYVLASDFKKTTASLAIFEKEGIVLEVSTGQNDFSLARLLTIFEQTGQIVIGFLRREVEDQVQVLIKIAPNAIQETLASLRRYGFTIGFVEGADEFEGVLRENAAYLDTYLNV